MMVRSSCKLPQTLQPGLPCGSKLELALLQRAPYISSQPCLGKHMPAQLPQGPQQPRQVGGLGSILPGTSRGTW